MRIIAGTLKGRRLKTPTWEGLRPTSDRLRETLFNILAPRIAGARVVDGYAGTGALGIEAISRGAGAVAFIEHDRRAQALIAENLAHCGVTTGYTIVRSDVVRGLEWLRAHAVPAADSAGTRPAKLRGARSAGPRDVEPRNLEPRNLEPRGVEPGDVQPEDASALEAMSLSARQPDARRQDLVLLDPPYEYRIAELEPLLVAGSAVLAADGLLVLEHARRTRTPAAVDGMRHARDERGRD
jgi:16S rRNA G966 N2-methylase RsmD